MDLKNENDLIDIEEEVQFADDSVAVFTIRDITDKARKLLLKQCKMSKKILGGSESRDIEDRYDWSKYSDLQIRKCVTGWRGLQNRHLSTILDCNKAWDYYGDLRKEAEIPFEPETLRLVAENHNIEFANWVAEGLKRIDTEHKKRKESQLKN